jgi:hypothetical protein
MKIAARIVNVLALVDGRAVLDEQPEIAKLAFRESLSLRPRSGRPSLCWYTPEGSDASGSSQPR